MRRLARLTLIVLTTLALVATCGFPPWDVCWHADGSACAEQAGDCCGDGSSGPADSCLNCHDVVHVPALASARPEHAPLFELTGALPAESRSFAPGVPSVSACWITAAVSADPPGCALPLRI